MGEVRSGSIVILMDFVMRDSTFSLKTVIPHMAQSF